MKRNRVPGLGLDLARASLVSSAGGLLLRETIGVSGIGRELSRSLAPWCGDRTTHDPAKVLLDVAVAVALGGDCVADVAAVRAQPSLFGHVASDPTVSRVFARLGADIEASLPAIRAAHAAARRAVWGRRRPVSGEQVTIDLDSTLVTAHSDKQGAEPTYKRGYGFSPMCSFVDHGEHGAGETLGLQLRPGRASPFDADDHLEALDLALSQLSEDDRDQVLVRADTGGCSKRFLHHITDLGLEYSIGFPAMDTVKAALDALPPQAWRAAVDSDGEPRDGAQVAELTAWMPEPTLCRGRPGPELWPAGMRVIVRRERPHPGAQLRLTDADGWRITCFVTNTRSPGWTLPLLEVRHRQRARCEDRIRGLKDTGMRNLPFHDYAKNQVWLQVVALACDLLAWTQTLAWEPTAAARRWEPKRLRLRILAVAGLIVRTGRRQRLRLPRDWPWNDLIDTGWANLRPG